MDFTGIIAEYDPFHNGHAAQLAAVRAAGAQCIAVCMSSVAVQRGGVTILPERVRVRAALDAGAELVITLPAPYASATAEQFASTGVRLLAALGCDTLVFGAEDPDAAQLSQVAELLARPELDALLRERLSTGMTYSFNYIRIPCACKQGRTRKCCCAYTDLRVYTDTGRTICCHN